jgi:hypothetical protein
MRNPLDIICGREIDHHLANSIRQKLTPTAGGALRKKIDDLIQRTIHIRLVDIPHYQVDPVDNNEMLRIGYLRKELQEDEFKKKVQRSNKIQEKKKEICSILQMFVQTVTDIFHRLDNHIHTKDVSSLVVYLEEVEGIRVYTNECLLEIATTYNQNKMILTEQLEVISNLSTLLF